MPIAEHTTDTHGATEPVFALFDLLGLSFIARLRDAGDLQLYLLGEPADLPVDVVPRARARPERIVEQYDDLLRTAASLKRGWVPASLLITRLKNVPDGVEVVDRGGHVAGVPDLDGVDEDLEAERVAALSGYGRISVWLSGMKARCSAYDGQREQTEHAPVRWRGVRRECPLGGRRLTLRRRVGGPGGV